MSNSRAQELLKEIEGWDALDIDSPALDKVRAEQEKEGRSLASLFHQAFVQNDAGRIVLDTMIKQTILKPTVTPNATQFEAGIREGRADMVRQILLNIELAEGS